MENCGDFLVNLGLDVSTIVLTQLDDPSDIVRVSSVSSSWRHFVIENHFCKKLCIRLFPEVSRFTRVVEVSNSMEPTEEVGTSNSVAWESLKRDHRIYAYLARCFMSPLTMKDCIETSIRASSTDNDPEENIENTLDPRERVDARPSYWSSTGKGDPEVPETLTYKLRSQLCVINEIDIRPFEATFQYGHPIYSSKAVRFRMGHPKVPLDWISSREFVSGCTDDNYVWTYVSPEFPMVQENSLQTFKLPKPVICIGGILQIELLGRIQKQEMDDLYYMCVCHVQAIGQTLSPVFNVDILDSEGSCVLKYSPNPEKCLSPKNAHQDDVVGSSGWQAIAARIRQIRDGGVWNRVVILNTLLGNGAPGSDYDSDEDFIK
eukprot:TRINITY_DN25733_c0_g1_i2.p1 TRINITY_DN25733_c0_g1~~TRINITY_DN25733_c0_g1_i2.p1  ORF type:complete len:376 (+),score=59.41 TRINITY_DN25733_c0_g1_i2:196-1323(+)